MLPNDVHTHLLTAFRSDQASVIDPLVALGWNASTTVTVAREATVFDDDQVASVPMWALALEAQAFEVLNAWLRAPEPAGGKTSVVNDVARAAQDAWWSGHYAQAKALTQALKHRDPDGHESRLRQALMMLSEPGARSLNLMAEQFRGATHEGLQHWHACGGNWDWVLEPLNSSVKPRHALDLTHASPVARWIATFDRPALDELAAQGVDWPSQGQPSLSIVNGWALNAVNGLGSPEAQPEHGERVMLDGVMVIDRMVRQSPHPQTWLPDLQSMLRDALESCVQSNGWNGHAQTWVRALIASVETRVLYDTVPAQEPRRPSPRL